MSNRDFNQTNALSTTNEWLTPPELITALGPFDLDPCAPPPERRPWITAPAMYDERMDGLKMPWYGRVFLNPPYGKHTFIWMKKLSEHKRGIALIFARTDTIGFQAEIFAKAHSIFFIKARLKFNGIISQAELDACKNPVTPPAVVKAILKRINNKTLNRINDGYHWFRGDSANAPSCLVYYSEEDTQIILSAQQSGALNGKLVYT